MFNRKRPVKQQTNLQPAPFKVGDSVIVKPGTQDPDYGGDIGGWQGRITEITDDEEGEWLVLIDWDSLTLRQIPGSHIRDCKIDDLAWESMRLFAREVELSQPRDTLTNVERVLAQLETQYEWVHLGEEEGRRIQQVLKGVAKNNDLAALNAWSKYLTRMFTFPFKAEVAEPQDQGSLRIEDRVTVLGIEEIDEDYGILVNIKSQRGDYVFPLCDLDALDQNSPNYEPLHDYAVWFANR
jgi:hypothetical protein